LINVAKNYCAVKKFFSLTGQKNKPHNKRLSKRDSNELGTKPNPSRLNAISISLKRTGKDYKATLQKMQYPFSPNRKNFFRDIKDTRDKKDIGDTTNNKRNYSVA
jgi:hypothetical protein